MTPGIATAALGLLFDLDSKMEGMASPATDPIINEDRRYGSQPYLWDNGAFSVKVIAEYEVKVLTLISIAVE